MEMPDGYVNLTELTKRLGYSPKSRGVVRALCQSGRIPGAYQMGNGNREWVSPWPVHPLHSVPDGYVSLTDLTSRLGYLPKSRGRVWKLCQSGQIPGAYQMDNGERRGQWVAPWPCTVLDLHPAPDGYQHTAEAAFRLGLTVEQMTRWCASELIQGAVKAGSRWLVPIPCQGKKVKDPLPGANLYTYSKAAGFLAKLSVRTQRILRFRYEVNDTLESIGYTFGLSRQRVYQVEQAAMAKLGELAEGS